jgi:small subunit ribosomal protein S9
MKIINTSGKRKRSVARATLKEGHGIIKINNKPLDVIEPRLARLKIQEAMLLAGNVVNKVNLLVNVKGGGYMSQADASRVAICRALVEFSPSLKKVYLDYDRNLLVADTRRKEMAKPNRAGQARAKVQKSYR